MMLTAVVELKTNMKECSKGDVFSNIELNGELTKVQAKWSKVKNQVVFYLNNNEVVLPYSDAKMMTIVEIYRLLENND